MRFTRSAGGWVLAGLLLALTGCASQGRLSDVYAAYRRGDYRTTYDQAANLYAHGSGRVRAPAAYMAGLAATHLRDRDTARRYLAVAANSGDDKLAGDAMAQLGLLYAQDGDHAAAASWLTRAAGRLTGTERAQALFNAALSQQKIGQWAQARSSLLTARRVTTDSALRQRVDEYLNTVGFTLQLGAFVRPANARKLAEGIYRQAVAARLGPPRLVVRRDAVGQTLTLVQVGQFSSYASAATAKARLHRQAIIVPLSGK